MARLFHERELVPMDAGKLVATPTALPTNARSVMPIVEEWLISLTLFDRFFTVNPLSNGINNMVTGFYKLQETIVKLKLGKITMNRISTQLNACYVLVRKLEKMGTEQYLTEWLLGPKFLPAETITKNKD